MDWTWIVGKFHENTLGSTISTLPTTESHLNPLGPQWFTIANCKLVVQGQTFHESVTYTINEEWCCNTVSVPPVTPLTQSPYKQVLGGRRTAREMDDGKDDTVRGS